MTENTENTSIDKNTDLANTTNTSNFYCPEPFIRPSTRLDGYFAPCCIASKNINKLHNMTVHNSTFDEFLKSDYLKQLKEDQINGSIDNFSDIVKNTCQKCLSDEKNNIKSYRQISIDKHGLKPRKNNYLFKIKSGNLCNLKCLSCFPLSSSLTAKESKDLNEYDGDIIIKNDFTYDAIKDIIKNDLVHTFDISGGEPLLNDGVWDAIDKIQKDKAKNITITFNTNGTILPNKKQFKTLEKFKDVYFKFSIDAWGERNDYLRFPSKFDIIEKNIVQINKSGFNIGISATISNLNIGYIAELHKKLKRLEKEQNIKFAKIRFDNKVTEPSFLRPSVLPKKIKDMYNLEFEFFNEYILPDEDNTKEFLEALRYLKIRDEYRGTNLLKLYPEFKEYMEML